MKDNENKTKEELIRESDALRQRLGELEQEKYLCVHTEKELLRVTRALKALSRCNQTLIRARDLSEFLREICLQIVENGGYRLAWFGFAEQDGQRPLSRWPNMDMRKDILILLKSPGLMLNAEEGQLAPPSGQEGLLYHKTSLATPIMPMRSEAVKRGYAASIALPLISEERTIGSLNIYAAEPDAFDEEEVKLLSQLANDITYGIGALEMRTKRDQAEAELKESFGKLKKALNGTVMHCPRF